MIQIESRDLTALVSRLRGASRDFSRDAKRLIGTQKRVVRTEAQRAIRQVYNVPAQRLLEDLRPAEADESTLSVSITGSRAQISLRQFGARQQGRGAVRPVTVQVKKGKPRATLKRGFLATRKGSNTPLVWQRVTRGGKRLPIEVMYGPSAADMLRNPIVLADLTGRYTVRATRELTRLIDRAVAKGT